MKLRYIIWSIISLFIIASCVKNEYIIDDYRGLGIIDWNGPRYPIFFSPKLETNYTRSLDIPFPEGVKARIYAFLDNQANSYISANDYYCKTSGILSSSAPLLLPYGTYNFRGISSLTNSNPPSVENNAATGLENGVDYVWGAISGQTINSPSTTLPITFYHQAVQLQFVIQDSLSDVKVTKIYNTSQIGVPNGESNSKWDIINGGISQITATSYTYATSSDLTINGLSISTICVPFTSSISDTVKINCINTNNDDVSFSVVVPIPTGGYVSGTSYNYNIVYAVDTVYTDVVTVLPWTEVVEPDVDEN